MIEKNIERKMCELIKQRGGLTYKFVSPNKSGVPDRIIVTPAGEVWFVELKTTQGRVSKIQKYQMQELKNRGANVRIVFGLDDVKKFVEEVLPLGI